MNRVVRLTFATLACTFLLGAADGLRGAADGQHDVSMATVHVRRRATRDEVIRRFSSGQQRFIMRRVPGREGAIDFRILGERGAPAILSLIGAYPDRYSDFTYNDHDADIDVSHGGLNLRPLDGTGSVNVWSMSGNTRLRVGSRDFRQSLDMLHDGENAYLRATAGSVIVESRLETRAGAELSGNISVNGVFRIRQATPASSEAPCQPGQQTSDSDYLYVCIAPDEWKRVPLSRF